MRRITRGLVLGALLVGAVASVPASTVEAGETPALPYTCIDDPDIGVPDLAVPLVLTASGTPVPAKVFQPITLRAALETPDLGSPLTLTLDYLRVRMPIPDGVQLLGAAVTAPAGETPNPPIADISVDVVGSELVVQLPSDPATHDPILVASEQQGGALTYPYLNFLSIGSPVVLPDIVVTAVATPDAAGTVVDWSAPEIDVQAVVPLPGSPAQVTCTPDGDPDPVIASTTVTEQVQQCDGRAVTVQLGFNAPTGGNDVIQGRPGNDTVNGLGGADRFCGLAGNDTFNGGAGNDRAIGGPGSDRLRGDAGNDRLQGDAGTDNLQGGTGLDTLIGGTQRDICNGGPQRDTAQTCEVRQQIP